MNTLPFALRRVHQDGTEEAVSGHPTFAEGWSAGQRAVHEDRENAYTLYRNKNRIARFGFNRLAQRTDAAGLPAILGALG